MVNSKGVFAIPDWSVFSATFEAAALAAKAGVSRRVIKRLFHIQREAGL